MVQSLGLPMVTGGRRFCTGKLVPMLLAYFDKPPHYDTKSRLVHLLITQLQRKCEDILVIHRCAPAAASVAGQHRIHR